MKFWVLEPWREEGASSSKACFTTSFRSWEHVHTHTHKVSLQYKIYIRWCNPTYICFPCTRVLRLAYGLCILVCFWACTYVVNNPCSNTGKRGKREKKIFSLLHAIAIELVDANHFTTLSPTQLPFHSILSQFRPTSITIPSHLS
jgi:hypothetical protein